MQLEQQLQILLDEAPQHGIPTAVMQQAVIPVLKAFAQKLRYEQYYLIESDRGDWLLTTLSHRDNPELEKTVIYAFATSEDANQFQKGFNSVLSTTVIPVTYLLFQLFAIEQVNSLIFLETPGNIEAGKEISRADLRISIQKQLQQLQTTPPFIA